MKKFSLLVAAGLLVAGSALAQGGAKKVAPKSSTTPKTAAMPSQGSAAATPEAAMSAQERAERDHKLKDQGAAVGSQRSLPEQDRLRVEEERAAREQVEKGQAPAGKAETREARAVRESREKERQKEMGAEEHSERKYLSPDGKVLAAPVEGPAMQTEKPQARRKVK